MDPIKNKSTAKTSAAIAGAVGVGAAYAAIQNQAPVADAQAVFANVADAAPVQQAAQAVAAEPSQVEELVQAYLGGDQTGVLNADALTAADIADMLPEPEVLDALASYPGVEVAQAEGAAAAGGGAGAGAGGGITGFLGNVGGALGATGAGAVGVGLGVVGLGAVAAGYGIDQAVNGC